MNKKWAVRFAVCLAIVGFSLYGQIDKQNQITALRIQLPDQVRILKGLQEENTRLHYEIEQFESPEHLIELARHQEYSHLRHPLAKEILSMPQGMAVQLESCENTLPSPRRNSAITLATGTP